VTDISTALAEIRYSPDIDLPRVSGSLERFGVRFQPLEGPEKHGSVNTPVIYLVAASWWIALPDDRRRGFVVAMQRPGSAVIVTGEDESELPPDLDGPDAITVRLEEPVTASALRGVVETAMRAIELRLKLAEAHRELERRTQQMEEVHRVGIALSAEKDLSTLQHLILRTSREATSADAGTLYLIEEDENKEKSLVFQYSQNDSVDAPYQRQVMPMSTASVSGYVAVTRQIQRIEDVYDLPADAPYSFNKWFDETFGYRTTSVLAVPMENHEGNVVGVIQLLNRKRDFATTLTPENAAREVQPFTAEDEQVLSSFASQAAVALENQMLLENIQRLFAGFVRASVTAIEARDPTTFGHSDRVARLTVGLAEAINEVQRDRWRDVHFSVEQLKELEYAGLLHDFGKVGVREHVLVKPKKLYDWKLQEVRSRFRIARQQIENRSLNDRLDFVLENGRDRYRAQEPILLEECDAALSDLDSALQVVITANEPSVLEEERLQWLIQVAERTVVMPDGMIMPLIDDDDMVNVSIRKGTLNEEERKEIESHVTHSFNFLSQIPWTKDLQGIPNIAYAHHEKLNGRGYPRHLQAAEIPIQAKMMTVSDIFDALTASDRPYKAAVPLPRALDILGYEVKDGGLDREILDLFIEKEVYRRVLSTDALEFGRAASAN
jgi:HD-GYP domain-containing protein (c-di-GMP phosphodiesterase class II)